MQQARKLADHVDALVCGAELDDPANGLVEAGVEVVFVADDAAFAGSRSQPCIDVLASLLQRGVHDTVLFPHSTLALDVAAGLAARLEAGINWGLVEIRDEGGELVGSRLALDDTVVVEVGWTTPLRLAVMRGAAPREVVQIAGGGVELVDAHVAASSTRLQIRTDEPYNGRSDSLGQASIIVSGGRGVGDAQGFARIRELADALGGMVGATMPVVDAGWCPRSAQIGQSGATVKPRVYIACGISGALQHKIGVEGSETIVAINSDPSAPIFGWCDLGIVGDVRDVVPRLLDLIRAPAESHIGPN